MQVRSRVAWVLTGAALDAVVLAAIWLLLQAVTPVGATIIWWLQVLGLAGCAWFVHVVALPAMLQNSGGAWVLRSVAFVISVGLFSPAAAVLSTIFLPAPLLVISALVTPHLVGAVLWWANELLEAGFWSAVGMAVGAVIGLLMGVARRLDRSKGDPSLRPGRLIDLLGGALGGLIAMTGLFGAAGAGLLSWPGETPGPMLDLVTRAPFRPVMIGVGVVALLPHLLMVRMRAARDRSWQDGPGHRGQGALSA